MAKVYVAFLWHHHQPYYGDARTGNFTMPWVRLHSLAAYVGMGRVLQEAPDMQATFNLVPSLVEQIQGYVDGTVKDEWLVLTEKPAEALTPREVQFVLQHFFSGKRETLILPRPGYARLLAKRSPATKTPAESLRDFTTQDLRDLQVWASLAWFHPMVVSYDKALRELIEKDSGYTEDDKAVLVAKQREILGQIVPLYRHLQDRGQIEITTSPYYHPIVPLLCNMASAREGLPNVQLPTLAIQGGDDADAQIRRGIEAHERAFGQRPLGMWPPEGAVSPRTLELFHAAGVQWTASDSDVLARSQLESGPADPYEPYSVAAGAGRVNMVFRDHELSDLIGFQYYRMDPKEAAKDFVSRLERIGAKRRSSRPPLVSIILDGENPWEQYANQGVSFLLAMYHAIARHADIEPTTFSRYLAENPPTRHITRIFSGSWIYNCFSTWVGHKETNLAWDCLAQAREALQRRERDGGLPADTIAQARAELYIAEGSDWFWWYGEDHNSPYDAQFDAAFRLHLKNLYEILGAEPPAALDVPIHRLDRLLHTVPVRLLRVDVDGRESDYFEWTGAGLYDVEKDAGAMQRVSGRVFNRIWFGCDTKWLYLRLDFAPGQLDRIGQDAEVRVEFVRPRRLEYTIGMAPSRVPGQAAGNQVRREDGLQTQAHAHCDRLLEAAIPLDEFAGEPDEPFQFYLNFHSGGRVDQSAPEGSPIQVVRPTEEFERIMWVV